ncbi:universal stress protein [Cellvibrio japonicus]|uniref:Universal stress protein n=1 Tax=Cellvibrio japonicus (strain Ueda107) TaxID=498211 RepID=B3PHL3_CELJU|nr:universal stress protein [Cellvibrio japonicus]ACE85205.1 universal stress protein family [Cellvibrio japonicus Ueda107]QEI12487.1 universal stress protein [Cellvibrio japonicus]QEI16061.1 universal stress protein [Cellvibrio japonicus]QEI19639.1 universal stress protein [Cellvibrio japonicus]
MSNSLYQHIIVGLDLAEDCPQVLLKAAALAASFRAKLTLAHVLEPIAFAYGGDMPVDLSGIQEQQVQKAETELAQLAKLTDYPIQQQHVLVGQPAAELHYLAEQESADLIIVGSHGRKGLALLLGSTPNSVLHGASCDVLAVLVNKSAKGE